MLAFVTVTLVVLMMFQPSRSLAVSMVRWSEVTFVQPLMRAAKWPPRRRVRPSPRRRPSQRVSEDLVGLAGLGVAGDEVAEAVDHALTDEADVCQPVAVDHRVVEVAVPVVLVGVVGVGLGRVVGVRAGALDRRALVHLKSDLALHVDGVLGLVLAGGEADGAAARRVGGGDGLVDGGGVVGGAVALGSVVVDVEDGGVGCGGGRGWGGGSGAARASGWVRPSTTAKAKKTLAAQLRFLMGVSWNGSSYQLVAAQVGQQQVAVLQGPGGVAEDR